MNVNIETPSNLRRKITIEVEPDEIKRELDRSYNELKRGVVLKGFRPGHAPRQLLERFFGDQVRGDVIQKLIKEYSDKALEENNLKPIVAPEIVTEETDLKKSLKFSVTFDLRPEIVVKDYEGLRVPESVIQVSDQQVDDAIQRIRERQAPLRKIANRNTVQEGDYVLSSIEASAEGKPLPDFKTEEHLLEVNKDALAHGLADILIGAQVGTPARGVKTYGQDYSQKDLAGKTIDWRVNVKEIYKRELPALDDEFAKDNDFTDLPDMRAGVRRDLEQRARAEADARARQGLLDLIIERNPVDLPESLVEREKKMAESELAIELEAAGAPRDQVNQRIQSSAEELRTRAEKRARSQLILEAIADQQNAAVSDEEVDDRIARVVTQAGRERDRIAEFYRHQENREALRQSIRREKALDALMTRAKGEPEAAAEPQSTA